MDLDSTPPMRPPRDTFATPQVLEKCSVDDATENRHSSDMQAHENHAIRVVFDNGLTLTTTSVLGHGGFGTVYVARSPSGQSFALKVSSKPLTGRDLVRLKEEVKIMNLLRDHPNVVRIHCAAVHEERAYIAMERCVAKSLNDVIQSRELLVNEFLWIGYQLVSTLAYMHRMEIIHRDIKPQNVLFNREGVMKLTDFGLSGRMKDRGQRKTVAGTQIFMAPEIAQYYRSTVEARTNGHAVNQIEYGAEVDVWSVGVALFVMATRQSPYAHHQRANVPDQEKAYWLLSIAADARWDWPNHGESASRVHPDVRKLIEYILQPDPRRRPTMEDILRHPIWDQRPLTCPLSLFQALSLLEGVTSPRHSKLRPLAPNTPAAKRRVEDIVASALESVAAAESARRADMEVEAYVVVEALEAMALVQMEHLAGRGAIAAQQVQERTRIVAEMKKVREKARRSVTRQASINLGTTGRAAAPQSDVIDPAASMGDIVRATSETFDFHYKDRGTATKWNLRTNISIPRDAVELPTNDRCLNNHTLRKIVKLPQGYEAFDCDICGRSFSDLTATSAILRCSRCDYDVCTGCAETPEANRNRATHFCTVCNKRFLTRAKLQRHTVDCRGPSTSPARSSAGDSDAIMDVIGGRRSMSVASPRQSSRASSAGRLSTGSTAAPSRPSGRATSGRPSGGRPSVGGRHSTGTLASGEWGDSIDSDTDRQRPSVVRLQNTVKLRDLPVGRRSLDLPPSEEQIKRAAKRAQPTIAMASDDDESPVSRRVSGPGGASRRSSSAASPARSKARSESNRLTLHEHPAPPPALSSAAAKPTARGREPSTTGVQVQLAANLAARPQEVSRRQPDRSRSVSKQQPPAPTSGKYVEAVVTLSASERRALAASSPAVPAERPREPPSAADNRKRALSTTTAPQMPPRPQPRAESTRSAVGPNRHSPPMDSVRSVPVPTSRTAQSVAQPAPLPVAAPQRRTSGAFMALPQRGDERENFVATFLSGAWVRSYAFAANDICKMYYSLQPGRIGAIFTSANGTLATAIFDLHSRMLLYVPEIDQANAARREPHSHVATAYGDELHLVTMHGAQEHNVLGPVLTGIKEFVADNNRRRAQGRTPALVCAPFVSKAETEGVARDTKWVYIRRVFPDKEGRFVLFRLSNTRSHVIVNAMHDQDIRWQSDTSGRMGLRYYVRNDGSAIPFTDDHYGVLTELEQMLATTYGQRR
jgi:serine/threonine protein kinase